MQQAGKALSKTKTSYHCIAAANRKGCMPVQVLRICKGKPGPAVLAQGASQLTLEMNHIFFSNKYIFFISTIYEVVYLNTCD